VNRSVALRFAACLDAFTGSAVERSGTLMGFGPRFVGWFAVLPDSLTENQNRRKLDKIIARTFDFGNYPKTLTCQSAQ